jgi:hypothetical protein
MMKKKIIFIPIVIILIIISIPIIYKWQYPYGVRSASLPLILNTLMFYSHENNGEFPAGGETSLISLQKLYPDYSSDECLYSGISGDEKLTHKTLKNEGQLNRKMSSWVYFPGFKTSDNVNIAIIWEKQDGITFNGRRVQSGSHAVGFVDGLWKQISKEKWETFIKHQKELREKVLNNGKEEKIIENNSNAGD